MYRVRQQDLPFQGSGMMVRAVTPSDAPAWLRLRRALWPHHAESEHAAEITEFLEGRAPEPLAVLVVPDGADRLIGFGELSIRAYAEGCHTDRVAYLEGWYAAAHKALGFTEVGRVRCFRKDL